MAEQDRYRAFQPGKQHKRPFATIKLRRQQAETDDDRPNHYSECQTENEPGQPDIVTRQDPEVDGESQNDKGHDLGEAGQRGTDTGKLDPTRTDRDTRGAL